MQKPSAPLKVSRILHAGYVFEFGESRILFDPIFENPFSRNCYAFPPVCFDIETIRTSRFSAVFISHFHDDHCSFDSLDLLDRATPVFVYCVFEELFELLRELGFNQVRRLKLDVQVQVGDFSVTARRACQPDVDSLLEIHVQGLKILNVVDAVLDPETLGQLGSRWDLVLWPFQTLRETAVIAPSLAQPDEALILEDWMEELGALGPRYVVPSSCQFLHEPWSWYNRALFPITYRKFALAIHAALPSCEVVRMNPGASIFLTQDELQEAPRLPWVLPIGPQDVDYDYRPDLPPPPMADIALNFPALNSEQTQLVLDFCTFDLPQRHKMLEPSPYFSRERSWRLSLYNEAGERTDFYYLLCGREMTRTSGEPSRLDWITEVTVTKLYAALALGETLASMYLRVSRGDLPGDVGPGFGEFDLFDDPLIRALFNSHNGGGFGSYQRQQLKQILGREK